MLTKNFEELRVYVAINNITSDACNISSLADGEDYIEYMKSRYGVPEVLTWTLESFFVELQPSEAIQFFTSLLDSIACDGKDLSKVIWKFLSLELRQLPIVDLKTYGVIEGMDLLSEGKPWPDAAQAANTVLAFVKSGLSVNYFAIDAARSAAYAAANSADAACNAYAAADAAAEAARAAARAVLTTYGTNRKRQRATLLKLIEKAPTPP